MIGSEYFELRSRLGENLAALGTLVKDLEAGDTSSAILDNLAAGLKDPFVFVVVGEVNVGKSTFLNALFGQEFSKTGVVPTTDKIFFFKHGPALQTKPLTSTLEEVEAPCDFLRDFHIVDTPGTNSVESEHQVITERFIPNADLVIFVFSSMNPWGASAWQFLEKVHKHWMRNVIFVLQQSDLRSTEEVQVIVDYMSQLARQRFGRDFPLFPVSAKKAYLARSSGLDRERLLAESGFLELEGYISNTVTRNAPRLGKLGNALKFANQILERLAADLHGWVEKAQSRRSLINELQTERQLQAQRTLSKMAPALDATERDYLDVADTLAGLTEEVVSIQAARRLGKEDDDAKPQSLDHRLFQEMMSRVGERWRQMGVILEEDHRQFSRYLTSAAEGTMKLPPLDDGQETEDPATETRRRFVARIESALRKFVIGLKLDEAVEPALARARNRERLIPRLAIPIVIAVTAAGWFGGVLAGVIAALCGMLVLAGVWLSARSILKKARHEMQTRLLEAGAALKLTLAGLIKEDAENTFARFLTVLAPVSDESDKLENHLKARTGRILALRESCDRLGKDLQNNSPAA